MDTSETYIKMCEKAEEIQRQWPKAWGDWYRTYGDDEMMGGISQLPAPESWTDWRDFRHIWLPRQDQLQEMMKIDNESESGRPEQLVWMLVLFADRGLWDYEHVFTNYAKQFTSMEQLWLAFVMKQNYNKLWTNENWTNENWV